MENVGSIKKDPHDSTRASGGISSIVSEEVESETQETVSISNKISNVDEETKKKEDIYSIENGDSSPSTPSKISKNEKFESNLDSPATFSTEKTIINDTDAHFSSKPKGNSHNQAQTQTQAQAQALDQAQTQPQTSNILMQQHHLVGMNQHVNTLNLVADYEAQMRHHLAAFSQAAAGAAWAAAQAASMPASTAHFCNSSAYPGSNAPLSPGNNSCQSEMSIPMSMSMPMSLTPPTGQMNIQIPMNNINFPTIPSPFLPPCANIHPIPMHHPPPHPEQVWQLPHHDQYQKDKKNQTIVQQQPRQRNRGRNDQNVGNQNHPNKRHQKIQEQQPHEEQQQEANINTQLQQMQFQSPTHQPYDESQHFIHSHPQIRDHSMNATAATNKRRHSSSTTWQVPFLHTQQMEFERVPKISHYPQQYNVDPNNNNTQKNRSPHNRLWSPNPKIDDKSISHKSHDNSSSPSMLAIQRNNLFINDSKYNNNDKHSNNTSAANKSNTHIDRSNRNARNSNSKSSRRRLRSNVDGGHSNSSGGGSHSNSSNNTPRKSKINKKRSSNNQSANSSPRPFNPTGKTGVMALHELCSKRHWPSPKFVEIQQVDTIPANNSSALNSNNDNGQITTNSSQSTHSQRTSVLLTNSFLISVIVQERELGRGRGGTKAAAKQDAARQALSVLLPNIAFDHNGILIQVGTKQLNQTVTTSIQSSDELAPLASKLAIHQGQSNESCPPLTKDSHVHCKPPNIYPCCSSGLSSASEDENSYYASRGASVCSTLLHAMWQIDQRIQEPPRYNFEVCSPPMIISSSSYKRTKGDNISYVSSTPVAVHRSSFACTASITLRAAKPTKIDDVPGGNFRHGAKVEIGVETDKDKKLEAIGTGATKREAKHIASAKLLALLFPDCNGMVEVMGAAEAAREKYAASKALTKQHKRALSQSNSNYLKKKEVLRPNESICGSSFSAIKNELWFALPKVDDAVMSKETLLRLQSINELNIISTITENSEKEQKKDLISHDSFISVAALSISESKDKIESAKKTEDVDDQFSDPCNGKLMMDNEISSKRQMIYQKQIKEEVDKALQKMLESDDENRSSLGGNSIDEVGRIILRRACVYDYEAVNNLLSSACLPKQTQTVIDTTSIFVNGPASQHKRYESNETNIPAFLWGDMSFILVLSRAIAGHDEPPLGCAVLTIQFTMVKGRILKICDMAHEVHLPRERFLECLEEFARNMECALDLKDTKGNTPEKNSKNQKQKMKLTRNQMKQILYAYCTAGNTQNKDSEQVISLQHSKQPQHSSDTSKRNKYPKSNSSLQAVEEEDSEEIEDEALKDESGHEELSDQVNSGRNQYKPSKRSRVS